MRASSSSTRIVGGAIPRQFIPAVEKGVRRAMRQGGGLRLPRRRRPGDPRRRQVPPRRLLRGELREAGALAFPEALHAAGPVALEPVSSLEVTVPARFLGEVLGDLNARRARVVSTEVEEDGDQVVVALVPAVEISRYGIDLRALSGGYGSFHAEHDHYDVAPPQSGRAFRADSGADLVGRSVRGVPASGAWGETSQTSFSAKLTEKPETERCGVAGRAARGALTSNRTQAPRRRRGVGAPRRSALEDSTAPRPPDDRAWLGRTSTNVPWLGPITRVFPGQSCLPPTSGLAGLGISAPRGALLITELVKSGELMTEYQENLPFMPITQGVVFPGMIVTLALETDEARAAVEAAGSAGGRLVLVPHIDRRYSSIGVVAEIVQAGEAGGGTHVVVLRGERRVTVGAAAPTTGNALWVTVEAVVPDYRNEVVDEPPVSTAPSSKARSCQEVLDSSLSSCVR